MYRITSLGFQCIIIVSENAESKMLCISMVDRYVQIFCVEEHITMHCFEWLPVLRSNTLFVHKMAKVVSSFVLMKNKPDMLNIF